MSVDSNVPFVNKLGELEGTLCSVQIKSIAKDIVPPALLHYLKKTDVGKKKEQNCAHGRGR